MLVRRLDLDDDNSSVNLAQNISK